MKPLLTKSIIIFQLATGIAVNLKAQDAIPKFEIGLNAGTFIYQGDLSPQRMGSYKTPTFTFGIFVNRIINPSFLLRTNLAIGKLKGDESKYSKPAYRQQRNFKFSSSVFELSELIVWNPLAKNYETDRSGFSPYLMAGGGFSLLKIKRDWSKFNPEYFFAQPLVLSGLAADSVHSLPRVIPVIPVGIGVRYSLSQKLSITGEALYRFAFTDYLDGFSQAANPERNDHYYSYTIGLIYRLGIKNKLNCPTIGH